MESEAVRRELHARATNVRARLADQWGTVPTRERTVPALDRSPPDHPDDLFPWTAVCVVVRDDEVLLLQDANHDTLEWEPPGGRGREGEPPTETARREVREVTGVTCDVTELLLVETLQIHYGGGDPYPVAQAVFAGPYIGGEAAPKADRVDAVRWFDATDLPTNVQYRSIIREHVGQMAESQPS